MSEYNPQDVEQKWQEFWEENKTFEITEDSKKKKFYALIEFPYPSGAGLHVGHPRSYTAMDVIARKRRMEGYNVLYPIGFDSFGLPTENYAIKTGRPPAEITAENIANFTCQLKSLGFSFDWSRAVTTSEPEYYKWTQWIFLQLFTHGLAYKKLVPINWCPSCKIGLANEEVVDGKCERCGSPVKKRNKEQWMLAITKYADSLLDGLKTVDYIEQAKVQQENWIGKSEGLVFTAPIKNMDLEIQTFSAHFEACYADTFVVIAPDHPLLSTLVAGLPNEKEVLDFSRQILEKRSKQGFIEEKELEGIFTGRYIVDPLGNGDLPIWVSSYALADYGTGIVKCSAHDERDFAFAKKYNIWLKPVLFPSDPEERKKVENLDVCFSDMKNGILSEPAEFDGRRAGEARNEIVSYLQKSGLAEQKVQYKLRDWVFSRQRYWGEPIPLVFCEQCKKNVETRNIVETHSNASLQRGKILNPGWIPLSEDQLPLELPKVEKYQPTDTGESPLVAMTDWVETICPRCGGPARRETDVMPNWAGSSWYFLRYCDPKNNKELASMDNLKYWMDGELARRNSDSNRDGVGGVDWYNGGMEHTVLHLLYSRFWNQFLYDIGVVPTREPYAKRTSHGLILAEDGEKMSKSRGNVVNPDEMVKKFGADALRAYEMFMGPFDQPVAWSTNGLIGVRRFLDRVWKLKEKIETRNSGNYPPKDGSASGGEIREMERITHKTIKKVSDDIESMSFNTAIAKLMELSNELNKQPQFPVSNFECFIKLLSPFAPHIAEELWSQLGHTTSLAYEPWPKYNADLIQEEHLTIVIQVNGKLRDTMVVAVDTLEEEVKQKALSQEKIQNWLRGKEPKKVIYVKGKLVSIVL